MGKKVFNANGYQHFYNISDDGGVLFYNIKDLLVFFTAVSTVVRRFGIRAVCFTVMLNHFHLMALFASKAEMNRFWTELVRLYVPDYNLAHNHKGRLFQSYGWSSKAAPKDIRSCIIYIGNNPVEKNACRYAEESRQTFLAYHMSDNPFSSPTAPRYTSVAFRSAKMVVSRMAEEGKFLNHHLLSTLFEHLNQSESALLADYIICRYNFIDYDAAASFFDGYDNMLLAMHSTTGHDYDMNEEYKRENYRNYFRAIPVLADACFFRGLTGYGLGSIRSKGFDGGDQGAGSLTGVYGNGRTGSYQVKGDDGYGRAGSYQVKGDDGYGRAGSYQVKGDDGYGRAGSIQRKGGDESTGGKIGRRDEDMKIFYTLLQRRVPGITHLEICRLLHWFPEKV